MNDTELLDTVLAGLEHKLNPILALGTDYLSKKEIAEIVDFIKAERAEEALNQKIKAEVQRQLKQNKK